MILVFVFIIAVACNNSEAKKEQDLVIIDLVLEKEDDGEYTIIATGNGGNGEGRYVFGVGSRPGVIEYDIIPDYEDDRPLNVVWFTHTEPGLSGYIGVYKEGDKVYLDSTPCVQQFIIPNE